MVYVYSPTGVRDRPWSTPAHWVVHLIDILPALPLYSLLPLPITQGLYLKQHLCNRRVRTGQDIVSYVFVIRVGYDFWVMGSVIIAEHQVRRLLVVVAIAEPLERSSSAENRFAHFEQSLVGKTQSQTEIASRGGQELLFIPFNTDSSESLNELEYLGEIPRKGHCPAATSFCSSSSLSCR